jgi:hypothetical protein
MGKPRAAAAALGMALLAAPRLAAACATCISSGFGDRSYNLAYLGLILMPFVVATVIVAVLAWYAGWRPRDAVTRIAAWSARLRHRPPRTALSPRTTTETT